MSYLLLTQDFNKETTIKPIEYVALARTCGSKYRYWAVFDETGSIVEHRGDYDEEFKVSSYPSLCTALKNEVEELEADITSLEAEICDRNHEITYLLRVNRMAESELAAEKARWASTPVFAGDTYGLQRKIWL